MKVFVKCYSYAHTENIIKTQTINQWCDVKCNNKGCHIAEGEFEGFYVKRNEFLTVQDMRKKKILKILK